MSTYAYAICYEKKIYVAAVSLGPNEVMADQEFIDFLWESTPCNIRMIWEHDDQFPPPGYSQFKRRI